MTTAESSSGRLRGADAVKLHLTLAAGLAICIAAFIFEVGRALGGNTLSWAYVFEWPIFAVFALYLWWNLLHDPDGHGRSGGPAAERASADAGRPPTADGAPAPEPQAVDPELAAWQAYLREMEAAEADDPDGPAGR